MNDNSILKLKVGSKITSEETLYEGYYVDENYMTANVSVDKIEGIMQHFIVKHDEPMFFILEIPSNLDDEKEDSPGVITSHVDVYYIDGCSKAEAITILTRVGEILYNDGLSSFGFGGHESGDEIMFGKYNVLTILSSNISQYYDFMTDHKIFRNDELITAFDTFSADHPGISERYEKDGKTVYDIPKDFEEWGIYLAEQREE